MNYFIDLNIDKFDEDVIQSSLPVLIYFYSEDCPQCITFTPIFERMAEKYNGYMKFVKINREKDRKLAENLKVKSNLTVLFYKEGNEVCSRLSGYISGPELKKAIETVIEGYCHFKPKERVNTDVLIIGAGPAGLSAAIYASRAKLDTVVIDESMPGGQVATTFNISNYPGTNGVVRGYDLMENMKRQAESFNTRIDDLSEIIEVNLEGDVKHIISESVNYYAKTVIIATGAKPRKLPAKGSDDYNGRGIHYCATCDGALYQEADLLVVGGGNSAVEEAVFLTKFAKHISLVTRNDYLSAAKGDQNELHKNPNIDIMWNKNIIEVFGENFLEGAIVEDRITNEKMEIKTEGIFVYIGMEPKTEFLKNKIELDDLKYVKVNSDMSTNIKGVYAAGDVVSKKIRQISTAVGDGTVAGIMVEKYINRVG